MGTLTIIPFSPYRVAYQGRFRIGCGICFFDVFAVQPICLFKANPEKKLHKSEDNFGTSSLEHAVLSKSTDIVQVLLDKYTHPLEKE